jgi:hypothetical protein
MQAANARRHHKGSKPNLFQPGELVWVFICSPPKKGVSKKLVCNRYKGPYQVVSCNSSGVFYQLQSDENRKLPVLVHQNHMKRFTIGSKRPALMPVADKIHHAHIPAEYHPKIDRQPLIRSVDSSEGNQPPLYEAEKIQTHKEDAEEVIQYQVKWKNFNNKNYSWVPTEEILDGPLVDNYRNKQRIHSLAEIDNEAEKIVSHKQDQEGNLLFQVKWRNHDNWYNSKVPAEEVLNSSLIRNYWRSQRYQQGGSPFKGSRKPNYMPKLLRATCLMFFLIGLVKTQDFKAYDCSQVTHKKVVGIDNFESCLKPVKDTMLAADTFHAMVKKFNTNVTKFDIFNCHVFTAKYKCKETWFWAKTR